MNYIKTIIAACAIVTLSTEFTYPIFGTRRREAYYMTAQDKKHTQEAYEAGLLAGEEQSHSNYDGYSDDYDIAIQSLEDMSSDDMLIEPANFDFNTENNSLDMNNALDMSEGSDDIIIQAVNAQPAVKAQPTVNAQPAIKNTQPAVKAEPAINAQPIANNSVADTSTQNDSLELDENEAIDENYDDDLTEQAPQNNPAPEASQEISEDDLGDYFENEADEANYAEDEVNYTDEGVAIQSHEDENEILQDQSSQEIYGNDFNDYLENQTPDFTDADVAMQSHEDEDDTVVTQTLGDGSMLSKLTPEQKIKLKTAVSDKLKDNNSNADNSVITQSYDDNDDDYGVDADYAQIQSYDDNEDDYGVDADYARIQAVEEVQKEKTSEVAAHHEALKTEEHKEQALKAVEPVAAPVTPVTPAAQPVPAAPVVQIQKVYPVYDFFKNMVVGVGNAASDMMNYAYSFFTSKPKTDSVKTQATAIEYGLVDGALHGIAVNAAKTIHQST
jgi:hypothetical protein